MSHIPVTPVTPVVPAVTGPAVGTPPVRTSVDRSIPTTPPMRIPWKDPAMNDTDTTHDLDIVDLLQATGFTPRDDRPTGRPAAITADRDHVRVILDDGQVEIHVFEPGPARIPRWSVTVSPATPLLVIIEVLRGAGVPVTTDTDTP